METEGTDKPRSNRGLLIGLGVGCLALVLLLLCGGALFAVVTGGALSFLTTSSSTIENTLPEIQGGLEDLQNGVEELEEMEDAFAEPTGIEIGVTAPGTVSVGESFELLVRVSNTAGESQTLDSIDFAEEYLEGISIQSADPDFSESFAYPGFYSYTFERSIPAGGELTVQFRAQAEQAGDFEGAVDVCINSPVNCLRETVRTSVNP